MISRVFGRTIDDIFSSSGWILMQDSILETLLVVDSTNKMTAQNFWKFIVKISFKAEIC